MYFLLDHMQGCFHVGKKLEYTQCACRSTFPIDVTPAHLSKHNICLDAADKPRHVKIRCGTQIKSVVCTMPPPTPMIYADCSSARISDSSRIFSWINPQSRLLQVIILSPGCKNIVMPPALFAMIIISTQSVCAS